nr:hypothetical protein [Marseillevirus cajuinensis]
MSSINDKLWKIFEDRFSQIGRCQVSLRELLLPKGTPSPKYLNLNILREKLAAPFQCFLN